jgi:hypothetical protein
MNHQPFEDWLLNDKLINPKEKLELEAHLRICAYCSALGETARVLRTVKTISPAVGFAGRFQARLAMQKAADRQRRFWGAVFFTVGGLVMLMWILSPYTTSFLDSPAAWFTALIGWGVFLLTTLQAVIEAGSVLLRLIPDFLSPLAWMVLISALAGTSLLLSVSIWRFVQSELPRGA